MDSYKVLLHLIIYTNFTKVRFVYKKLEDYLLARQILNTIVIESIIKCNRVNTRWFQ